MSSSASVRTCTYDDGPAAFACLGTLNEAERELLRSTLEAGRKQLAAAWEGSAAKREIFWINLWQRTVGGDPMDFGRGPELDRWVRQLVDNSYPGLDLVLDGYGFIINPVNSKMQPWHVDYTMDYSTVFIPLSRLTPQNCTQYVVLPPNAPDAARRDLAKDLNVIDLDALCDACDFVSVRQLLARPFSVFKMDFGTIHRGVANTGGFERIMFWISVSRSREPLPAEPVVEVIH